MNKKKSILECNVLYTIIAIIIGFLVGAIFLTIAGISPAVAYGKLFSSIFSKPKYLVWTLVYAAPLIFTGLSVAFSFRTGVFNIGAEGQFVIGGLVACILGIVLKLPAGIHAIVCLVAAAAAGCIWSLIVGVLKVKRGIHEVLSFIMFNWIAFYLSNYMVNLPFIHRDKTEATQDIAASARLLLPESLRNALGCTSAHWGFVLAVVAAIVIWIIIEKTTLGYKLKAVGFNSSAAEYGGIDANRSILTALGISGLLSGLGGAVQVLGMSGRLSQFAGQEGFGFEGITVALIGSSNPIGCIFSGLFYGAMKYGGSKLSIVKAPSEVVDIIMGCVVLLIAIAHVFKYFVLKTAKKKEAK
ncbi:ABC transporter permease [Clostridium sp. AF32-12BH]|uniref:ABC transporter permease n=1 Tax=Clostridium sp. AF32-12BH TaxID=2292006 RepID=UPI000E498ADF|nr:ABC transporter permease [Clostridium sp. AF32-12BH]RHP48465.1 ABC transporter permease [Clostridium sp. AF32-12BH]